MHSPTLLVIGHGFQNKRMERAVGKWTQEIGIPFYLNLASLAIYSYLLLTFSLKFSSETYTLLAEN